MFVKQVSVFVDNKKGSISNVISILGKEGISISALSVADALDFGILRLIVDEPTKAYNLLLGSGYKVKLAETIGILVENKANALGLILDFIRKNDIEITYIYSLIGYVDDNSVIILKTPNLSKTKELLDQLGVKMVDTKLLYKE